MPRSRPNIKTRFHAAVATGIRTRAELRRRLPDASERWFKYLCTLFKIESRPPPHDPAFSLAVATYPGTHREAATHFNITYWAAIGIRNRYRRKLRWATSPSTTSPETSSLPSVNPNFTRKPAASSPIRTPISKSPPH